MSKIEKYGFVYIWYDRKHKRYYVGCHWGFEDDGYICSSNWMSKAYKRRPTDFKRRIIKRVYTNRQDTFKEEQYYLDMIKPEEIKIKYYNLHTTVGHWIMDENKSKSVKDKMRKPKSNTDNMKKPKSEEHKKKLSEAAKNRKPISEETRAKLRRPLSEETKYKMSISRKGHVVSEETKRKISESSLGKKMSIEANLNNSKAQLALNKKLSVSHKQKLLESHLNKPMSDETKRKIGDANRNRHTRKITINNSNI